MVNKRQGVSRVVVEQRGGRETGGSDVRWKFDLMQIKGAGIEATRREGGGGLSACNAFML